MEINSHHLVQTIFEHEVFLAIGCTEPIACAYAAALAAAHFTGSIKQLILKTDSGTFKNGSSVIVPFSNGEKGNLIAACLGAFVAKPSLKLEILKGVTPEILQQAKIFLTEFQASNDFIVEQKSFHIELTLKNESHQTQCILHGGHTNIQSITVDGSNIQLPQDSAQPTVFYRDILRQLSLEEVIKLADSLDDNDLECIRNGIKTNLEMADAGMKTKRIGYQIKHMQERGILKDDLFYKAKTSTASAIDGRMCGVNKPVMTSGGSGNQGITVTLTLYALAQELNISESRMLKSIAVAHLVNAYIKCFLGGLSPICGCAIGAGIAAAVAIVHLFENLDMNKITLAVNNVIGDLAGLICDGAKPGCSLKAVTSVDSALRAAFMALDGHGLTTHNGLTTNSAEDSIRNLERIVTCGMGALDPAILSILSDNEKKI